MSPVDAARRIHTPPARGSRGAAVPALAALLLSVLVAPGKASAQEETSPPPERGFSIFPFYIHRYDPASGEDVLRILGLYHRTRRHDGSGSTLLLPFFYSARSTSPPGSTLHIFPFFYSGSTDRGGYTYLIPFWYRSSTEEDRIAALFPFYYEHRRRGAYDPTFFRHFFLSDYEEWTGGSRLSVGQILFDRLSEPDIGRWRLRLLYPLFEFGRSEGGFHYRITPLIAGEASAESGRRLVRYRLVPFVWIGSEDRLGTEGEWHRLAEHFYLFPLFGYERRSIRSDYYAAYPFIHWQESTETFRFELRPFFFYADNPAVDGYHFWPLLSVEIGETAGESWAPRYLFAAKFFDRPADTEFRLDPFLFRFRSGEDRFGLGAPFDLFAYDTYPEGYSWAFFPLSYRRDDRLHAFRVWPFHASESGEGARGFRLTELLYLSKLHRWDETTAYRLDPFLFRLRTHPEGFSAGGLFELFGWSREGENRNYRLLPFFWGGSTPETSRLTVPLAFYSRYDSTQPIRYLDPLRFLAVVNSLGGSGGERHVSVLAKLFEHTWNEERPRYHDTRVLQFLFIDRSDETTRSFQINPFFQYHRDETTGSEIHSVFWYLFRRESEPGGSRIRILGIPFGG